MFPARILLATDGSREAGRAARVAIGLSNGLDSELHVGVAPSAYAAAESEILDFEFYEKIIDYLTVMMVAVVAGAVLTIVYGLMFLEAPLADQRPWGWAFAVVGLLLGETGLHLVLTWPLPGAYNIVMGEPALYFGLVLLGMAFAIRTGENLMPLAVLAFFGGIANIFLSIAMLVHDLSRNPPLWAIAYAAIGFAAVLAPLVVSKVRALRWARLVAGVLLAIGALIFALGGYGAYLEHTSAEEGFGKWTPPTMRQGP